MQHYWGNLDVHRRSREEYIEFDEPEASAAASAAAYASIFPL